MKPTPTTYDVSGNGAGCDTDFLSRHSSKVLIQDATTHRYLAADGRWTSEPNQATTFRSGSAAIEYVTQRKLKKVRLVLNRTITVSEVISVADLIGTGA